MVLTAIRCKRKPISMGLLPDTKNLGCACTGNAGNVFPRHRLQRTTNDPGMHHGTCVTHVPWYMSGSLTRVGGENVPGIPGACATRNFTYLAWGPWANVPGAVLSNYSVSNHLRLSCLPNRVFKRRSKKASKLRFTGLCEGNPLVTGGSCCYIPLPLLLLIPIAIVTLAWGTYQKGVNGSDLLDVVFGLWFYGTVLLFS